MSKLTPFHIAIPVDDLEAARKFYGEILECPEGRSDTQWIDFDFKGHQLVVHYQESDKSNIGGSNPVDGHAVPIPHYGIVLEWEDWEYLADRLRSYSIDFMIEPYVRFKGLPGEQATMFLKDPAGNALEFKAFKDITQLFAK